MIDRTELCTVLRKNQTNMVAEHVLLQLNCTHLPFTKQILIHIHSPHPSLFPFYPQNVLNTSMNTSKLAWLTFPDCSSVIIFFFALFSKKNTDVRVWFLECENNWQVELIGFVHIAGVCCTLIHSTMNHFQFESRCECMYMEITLEFGSYHTPSLLSLLKTFLIWIHFMCSMYIALSLPRRGTGAHTGSKFILWHNFQCESVFSHLIAIRSGEWEQVNKEGFFYVGLSAFDIIYKQPMMYIDLYRIAHTCSISAYNIQIISLMFPYSIRWKKKKRIFSPSFSFCTCATLYIFFIIFYFFGRIFFSFSHLLRN